MSKDPPNIIKDRILPIVTILSIAIGIWGGFRGCKRDKEDNWSFRPQIQEQYYLVSSSADWELETAGVARKNQYLKDQLTLPLKERHPVFQCRIALTDVAKSLDWGPIEIWSSLEPYADDFYPKYIQNTIDENKKNSESESDLLSDDAISDMRNYVSESQKMAHSRVQFLLLDLENIGDRIATEIVLHYRRYTIAPKDVFDLSLSNSNFTDLDYDESTMSLGELRPMDRIVIPLGMETSFDLLDAMRSVPVGERISPIKLEFIDRATGNKNSIKIRGPINQPIYINDWIYGKG